ncbi:hypothetical protein AAG570_010359 [Ranatra chinensis]|uniref:Solute carrier organic anion transporter family member n=1 Tax=Ranatra chinensis TaxID=642074 RepID=A0ABD0ZAN2_9HEMI
MASKKVYVIIYGILGSSQSAIGAYFIGTISTIEKRFKMPSTSSGLIASAWDIGALCCAMLMAYFGSNGHKTRWVTTTAVIAAFSCFLRYVPHHLFGAGTESSSKIHGRNISDSLCDAKIIAEDSCSLESDGLATFIFLFIAHIALGIGTSTYHTLGAAYLDDNSLKNKVPILFALSTSLRMIGPSVGFLLASYTLKIYIDPDTKPSFDRDDPRWVGSWALGWMPLGVFHLIMAALMAFFPRTLPREALRRKSTAQTPKAIKKSFSVADFIATMKRLVNNKILMFNSFSSTFYTFGMIGYWIFMPKYMETQFRQSASTASLVTGSIGLIFTALGVIVSGAFISKFRPRPQYLAAWNVFTETVDIIGHFAFAFLGCPKDDLHGRELENGKWQLVADCNANCNCASSIKYDPICSMDKTTTFFSPCHGGCTISDIINGTKIFSNCSCIPDLQATDGACPVECQNQFIIFLMLLCGMKLLSATGRAGNILIQFRSVSPEDKSVSIALAEVLLCAVAYIPAPIIYGMLLDYSCLVWGEACGVTGNCWLYNGKILRYLLNFTASGNKTLKLLKFFAAMIY